MEEVKIPESKFKVGDRVKVVNCLLNPRLVGSYATVCDVFYEYLFKGRHIYKLKYLSKSKNLNPYCWWFDEKDLEFASTKKINLNKKNDTFTNTYEPNTPNKTIVSHKIKGNKTTVTLSDGSVGTSRCNPEDNFDAYIGLKLATERAYGITAKEEPQVKEVNRKAKVGEYIKIVNEIQPFFKYRNGDILKVIVSNLTTVIAKDIPIQIRHEEYVVLENYKPEGNEKPKLKFKEGDCVFVRNATIGCQGANGYRGKVTNSEATNGLLKSCGLDTTNVRLENGEIWRVNTDGLEFAKSTL